MRIYDTHAHILLLEEKKPALLEDLKAALEDAENPFCHLLDIATHPADFEARARLRETCGIRLFTEGIYPSHAQDEDVAEALNKLEAFLAKTRPMEAKYRGLEVPSLIQSLKEDQASLVPALGELGLDCYHSAESLPEQIELFKAQVRLANAYELPLVIHCREAFPALFKALKELPCTKGGVLHCFSGNAQTALELYDQGFFISFALNASYEANAYLREAQKALPLEAILLETDSPYLGPWKTRYKPNLPQNVLLGYENLAQVKGIDLETLSQDIEENFKRFISQARLFSV